MNKTLLSCSLAAVLSLGTTMSVSAAEVIHHAGIKFVVADEPQARQGGETFETAGITFTVPIYNQADSDLAALEETDGLDSLIWPDDDPDIVLSGD